MERFCKMKQLRKLTAVFLFSTLLTISFSACSNADPAPPADAAITSTSAEITSITNVTEVTNGSDARALSDETAATAETTSNPQQTASAPETAEPAEDHVVHMLAVGDNLVQTYVYRRAQECTADGTSYYFQPLYENVKPIIEAADVAVINQETLICGGDYEISGSGFNFNSPVQLGDAMVDLGFDVFTIANNHMLDKHIDGLESSLDYWDGMMSKYPILTLGAYRNADDQNRIRTQDVNGIKIAYLAYTETLNGYTVPEDSTVKIGMLTDEALVERQIKEARQLADAVVVAAHWGKEDTHVVQQNVKELAEKMIKWGADVIIGTHPHTAQTMEYIERDDGSLGFVFYSLGNFISAQTDNFNMVGEMGGFDLVKDSVTGKVSVLNVKCMPVITHYDNALFGNLRLYPYNQYSEALASQHGLPYAPMGSAKSFSMDVINDIIQQNIPEEFQKLD
ncbi:MAG TPA: capsule biosynthesis protein [Ruminococcus sp.]|nr:capsule biosynthesis protein [Ruminococcus sp.]